MTDTKGANAVRWTPRRIRAALKCPKPSGEVRKIYREQAGELPGASERCDSDRVVEFIAEHADMLNAPTLPSFERPWRIPGDPCGWLLIPATTWLLDALALVGDSDDLETEPDWEPDADQELEEIERANVRPGTMDRHGLTDDGPDIEVTAEQRQRYRESDLDGPMQQAQAFIRVHKACDR